MRLALFQPDIPQNLGAAIRLCACLAVPLDIIEPCAFPLDDRSLKRAALDYGDLAQITRHISWSRFAAQAAQDGSRLVLMTTKGTSDLHSFAFSPSDTLLMGSESSGAPPEVHALASGRVRIAIHPRARSLNIVTAATLALGEALRQTGGFP